MHAKIEGSTNLQHIVKAFFIGLLKQKTYKEIADEKKLHLVEFKNGLERLPCVVASPDICRTQNDISTDEIMNFSQHILEDKIVLKKRPLPPFYFNSLGYKLYCKTKRFLEIKTIDSDDSSSSSDVEYLNELRKTIEKRIDVADDNDGEDDEHEDYNGKKRQQQKLRAKGELLLEDLAPIQDLQITVPENDCIEFGKIHSIVDQLVLVSALPNSILLNLETVIFLEKGQKVLVFDLQLSTDLLHIIINIPLALLHRQEVSKESSPNLHPKFGRFKMYEEK
ncbi:hypothetical protein EVAR_71531_1 [Eumeta japonica]|uniref:Small ribosomal subunit protein uS5 C-terminal domain-containing protein n=1 Tax=Eumeta variegata TaxID=151549 RepID=A0A4C1T3I6_EUMVA|nr:hypothetical protein EVAR_71531_1 [Eumeta japonica]